MKIRVRRLRNLSLERPSAPGRGAFISAASGLVVAGGWLYVIADDELHLGVFRAAGTARGALVRLMPGTLPLGKKKRKALKADFEVLTLLPAFTGCPRGALLALGSGSRRNRRRGVLMPLDRAGAIGGAKRAIDLSGLYAALGHELGKVNVEGAAVVGQDFCLLNRGHPRRGGSAVVRFSLRSVLGCLARDDSLGAIPCRIRHYDLGSAAGVPLGFTDGTALVDGRLVFIAVAERADDSYQDGPCVAAAMGSIAATGELEWIRRFHPPLKVEGITAQGTGRRGRLLLVTDADDPAVPSVLYAAALPQRPATFRPARALRELEALKLHFGDDSAERKAELLGKFATASLASERDVLRLHEVAAFLRAHPDDRQVLERVERLLRNFSRRADLRRFRRKLADSGIAGTALNYSFYSATALRVAARWGRHLHVNWRESGPLERLEGRLALLASYAETPGLDEYYLPLRQWIARLKGPLETDAQFLLRRIARLGASEAERDLLYDEVELALTLQPGPTTPSRTAAYFPRPRIHFQTGPLRSARPDIRRVLAAKPPAIRAVSEHEGAALIELARDAMLTRSRDLDAFIHGDPRDVRLIDCGDGLEFAAIGVIPERRLMLESVYGFLTLRNGVPIGYVLTSALFGSSEIAYNVFDTWRGGEAGHVYGQVLAMTKAVFGSADFTIFPYQLGGDGNAEGIASGAWWFYQKLGFRPRDPAVQALMERELARMAKRPGHRSTPATLKALAAENMYWYSGRARDDVIGILPLHRVGLAVTDYLAARFGADRERGERVCADEAARRCGVRGWQRWPAAERLWWARWSPLVLLLPGLGRWTPGERAALVRVVRAKGGRRETDFVRLFAAHRPLRRAILKLVDSVSD